MNDMSVRMRGQRFLMPMIVLSVAFVASGCTEMTPPAASGSQTATVKIEQVGSIEVPAGKAVLFFFREKEFSGSANTYRLSVNGQSVADMPVGTRYRQDVLPGQLNVKAQTVASIFNFGLGLAMMEKPEISLNAKKGEVYAIEIDPGFAGGPVFKQVSLEDALQRSQGFGWAPPAAD